MRQQFFNRYSPFLRVGHLRFQDTNLFLAFMLWLCTLPILALVALPFLGWKVTAYIAGGVLVADLTFCWFLCTFRMAQKQTTGSSTEFEVEKWQTKI